MPTRVKVLLAALFAVGVGVFVSLAFVGGGGRSCTLPDGIEEVLPDCNTSVLGQTQVGVRVAEGYTAQLTLNGVAIPDDQITSGGQIGAGTNGQASNQAGAAPTNFFFLPPIDGELALQPTNVMTVRFWRLAEGEETARTYPWRFSAA
jgi:hypothetical protein